MGETLERFHGSSFNIISNAHALIELFFDLLVLCILNAFRLVLNLAESISFHFHFQSINCLHGIIFRADSLWVTADHFENSYYC